MNSSPYVDSTYSGIIETGIVKFLVLGCVGSERIPVDVVGPRGVFDDSSLLVCVGNERRHCFPFTLIVGRCCLVVGSTRFRQLWCRCLRVTLIISCLLLLVALMISCRLGHDE